MRSPFRDSVIAKVVSAFSHPSASPSTGVSAGRRTAPCSRRRLAVGALEPPAGKQRLDDLEAMGDPADRAENGALVHAGGDRRLEAEHDLRLDPRLDEMGDAHRRRPVDVRKVVS